MALRRLQTVPMGVKFVVVGLFAVVLASASFAVALHGQLLAVQAQLQSLRASQSAEATVLQSNRDVIAGLSSQLNSDRAALARSAATPAPTSLPTVPPAATLSPGDIFAELSQVTDSLGNVWGPNDLPSAYVRVGTRISFTATGLDPYGRALLYQYVTVIGGQGVVLRSWSSSPSFTWMVTSASIGDDVNVQVAVKSASGYHRTPGGNVGLIACPCDDEITAYYNVRP